MAKEIFFYTENQAKILEGVNWLADSVRTTLGPKGRNAVIDRAPQSPLLTNDGATIAKEIDLKDPAMNMGAQIIREVSAKTNDLAGDGTTTATVLAQAMIKEGFRLIAAGANPVALRRGISEATQVSVAAIRKLAKPISSSEDVAKVATISAEDEMIGGLVARAFDEVGVDGVITAEESHQMEANLKVTRGMQFDRGYISQEMVNDPEHMLCELSLPYILVTNQKITSAQDLLPVLALVLDAGRPLLIIAEEVSGEALALINVNVMRGLIKCAAVKAPAYGDGRVARLKDIALFTGATYVAPELGLALKDVKLENLGTAQSVRVERSTTSIVDGGGDAEAIRQHIAGLRVQIANTDYGFAKDQLKERLAKLAGGVVVIEAGAPTEVEMLEQKLRIEDAIHAARAALKEGVALGGGTAYINILPAVRAYVRAQEGDKKLGGAIVMRALEAPVRQIAENCGMEPSVVVEKVKEAPYGVGFNAATGEYVDMMEAGIVDSVLVTRLALQSAASAASVLLTTEAGVVDIK